MTTIELSSVVVEGLKNLNTILNADLTRKLVSNVIKMTLHSDANLPANPEIYATKPDYAKQAEYSVLTTLMLAIKHNYDNKKLRHLLEHYQISNVAIEEMIKVYEINKIDLQIKAIASGHSLQHVTSIEWKLTCDIKYSQIVNDTISARNAFSSSSPSSSNKFSGPLLQYTINFGCFNERTGERTTITEFVCHSEELQSLVWRLKEIQRHCEKISNK